MNHESFYDFKEVGRQTLKKRTVNTSGERVHWLNMKWIRVDKEDPGAIYYKYGMEGQFMKTDTRIPMCDTICSIPSAYSERLPISDLKKKDLIKLCRLGVIPFRHHDFYYNLPSVPSKDDNAGSDSDE